VFRRNPAIQRPTSMAIRQSVRGIAYLAPEIQLLYKARPIRTQDQIDFDLVVVALDPSPETGFELRSPGWTRSRVAVGALSHFSEPAISSR